MLHLEAFQLMQLFYYPLQIKEDVSLSNPSWFAELFRQSQRFHQALAFQIRSLHSNKAYGTLRTQFYYSCICLFSSQAEL